VRKEKRPPWCNAHAGWSFCGSRHGASDLIETIPGLGSYCEGLENLKVRGFSVLSEYVFKISLS
jgi:hypothetical protein